MNATIHTIAKSSFAAAIVAAATFATPAAAVVAGPPMETAFAAWKAKYKITTSSLVVYNGTEYSFDANASKVTRLASTSKAITAVCIGTLVRDRKLTFASPLISLIPRYFGQYGYGFLGYMPQQIADQQVARVAMPVAALLTHTSRMTFDTTQGNGNDLTKENNAIMLYGAFNRLLGYQGQYVYNNVNYTTLAMIIESMTGETYETYCKRAVLTPAGITTARLSASVRLLGGAGGWEMSPLDYMKFLNRYIGPRPTAPVIPVQAWPGVSNLKYGESAYGPGASVRTFPIVRYVTQWIGGVPVQVPTVVPEYNFWHSGGVNLGTGKGSFGSYFVTYGVLNKAWFATFSPKPSDAAYAELDKVMGEAAAK